MRRLPWPVRDLVRPWAGLSLDAKVVGVMAVGNWLLLFSSHTVVQIDRDAPLWQLFPGLWGAAWMIAAGLLAVAYPLRDRRLGARFTSRQRVLHLAVIVALFVILPTIAEIVLRATGKPYTFVHDGAIMIEEAARKLLAGQDPYVTDYLDTPLFYWPMINNPALYHLTYFPLLFLVTVPFVALFDKLGLFFDERYLYLPAYVATLFVLPLLLTAKGSPGEPLGPLLARRSSLVAIVGLNPQLFPFVAEGRNDFAVLLPLFAGVALLQREHRTLGVLALCAAASLKLHAGVLLPFVLAYLVWTAAPRSPRELVGRVARDWWAGALLMVVTFAPFLASDLAAFWDDIVLYNAGGSPWSYPISGMGFSAILRSLGVISYPQQEFPFWIFELAAAVPLALVSLARLRRDPSVSALLGGYAATLLAFLFFGRYFQGNYLGFIIAVATPVAFMRPLSLSAIPLPRRAQAVPAAAKAGAELPELEPTAAAD